jgi:hypothetical protein
MAEPAPEPTDWREAIAEAAEPPPLDEVLAPVLALVEGASHQSVLAAVRAVADSCREQLASYRAMVRDAGVRHLGSVVKLQAPARVFDAAMHEAAPPRANDTNGAEALVDRARAACDLFHDGDGNAYADVQAGGHRETHLLKGGTFRRWLVSQHFAETEQAVAAQAVTDAVGVLEGFALRDGEQRRVFVRFARGEDGRAWLDLGDSTWRAVEITAGSWRVVDEPDVRFLRPRGLRALPVPERGGSVDLLFESIDIVATEPLPPGSPTSLVLLLLQPEDRPLVLAWLVAVLLAQPPYAIGALTGEQGAGKSTTTRTMRSLIDPAKAALRGPPRDERDLVIAANASGIVAFDNISTLPERLSDALCRLATGAGFSTRALYTDSEEFLFEGARPILLTGITKYVQRPDLMDRALPFRVLPLEGGRVTEDDFYATLASVHGQILGALLDLAARAQARLADARVVLGPIALRMADFAKVGVAVELAQGGTGRVFLDRYKAITDAANAEITANDEVASRVIALMEANASWEGTATALLDALSRLDESAKSRLPRGPRGLTAALDRLAPNLRRLGIRFTRCPRGDARTLSLTRAGVAPEASPPSATAAATPSASSNPDQTGSSGTSEPCTECGSEAASRGAREGCGLCSARTLDDWGSL